MTDHITNLTNIPTVEEELIKVVRIRHTNSNPPNLRNQIALSEDFTSDVISGVRFAALARRPRTVTIVPSRVWDPVIHQSYPESFQKACKTILMCSNAAKVQPPELPTERINSASKLPKLLWMEILSYTHRSWFEQSNVTVELLQKRLSLEQVNVTKANEAACKAEKRIRVLERERDNYRQLAMLWQSRFLELANGQVQDGKTLVNLMNEIESHRESAADESDDDISFGNDFHAADSMGSSDGDGSSDIGSEDEFGVFMQDDEEEQAEDNSSANDMELTISNESAVARTIRTVSISQEPSP